MLNIFVNKGTDDALAKSFNKSGLVETEVVVNGRYGPYRAKRWVKPAEAAQAVTKDLTVEVEGKHIPPVFIPVEDAGKPTVRTFSTEEVINSYASRTNKSEPLKSWMRRNYFISDGLNETKEIYGKMGQYDGRRKQLHDRIISKIVSKAGDPKPGEKPVAILMGGGTASGKGYVKSTMVEPVMSDYGIKATTVDPDDIKKMLPEYRVFQDQYTPTAASRTHEESSDLSKKAIDALIKGGKNFIWDGTMSNVTKYKAVINRLKEAGFEVKIVNVATDFDVSVSREAERAKKTGRKVPEYAIKNSHMGNSAGYQELIGLVDDYILYDNSSNGVPTVIQSKDDGVVNEAKYKEFLAKGDLK